MEITYESIIQHLCKKKEKVIINQWFCQKNIHKYVKEWDNKFKDYFSEKFYRYGVTIYDKDNNNISFWTSLLTLLDKKFITCSDELEVVNNFKNKILDQYNKVNIEKYQLRTLIKCNITVELIEVICKILNINIIILDWSLELCRAVYSDYKTGFNPFIPTIFLANSYNYFEPIMNSLSKGTIRRTFNYNDIGFKKFLESKSIYCMNGKDNFFVIDINTIIKNEKKKYKQENINISKDYSSDIDSNINTDGSINTDASLESDKEENSEIIEELKKISKSKMMKMTKDKLLEYCDKLNLTNTMKDTKEVIISSINKLLV